MNPFHCSKTELSNSVCIVSETEMSSKCYSKIIGPKYRERGLGNHAGLRYGQPRRRSRVAKWKMRNKLNCWGSRRYWLKEGASPPASVNSTEKGTWESRLGFQPIILRALLPSISEMFKFIFINILIFITYIFRNFKNAPTSINKFNWIDLKNFIFLFFKILIVICS